MGNTRDFKESWDHEHLHRHRHTKAAHLEEGVVRILGFRMTKISRRHLLDMLGALSAGAGASLFVPLLARALPGYSSPGEENSHPLFVPIPPNSSGITWTHVNGRSPEYYLPETTGGGCAFFDFDNDGWMDIYLVNSGRCDFYDPDPPLRNALYKNNRDGTFTDVTEKAGVGGGGYGMGVAVGDYDGDGWPDLYVTQYGRSILYQNNGDGTFTDATERAGVAALGWGSSAVWFDYDNDGLLDLFVCRFVDFSKSMNKFCGNRATNERYYCYPRVYPATRSWLFHNNGDGTFTDVTLESGIGAHLGKAWGVVATDINNDGWMDLFVANDTVPNFLFLNKRDGTFEEIGLEAGVAYSADGRARSGMGVDAADYDQDGWEDLFVDNVDQEMYSLYHNDHNLIFDDMAETYGIAAITRLMSGWGVKFFDYDNDGNADLLIANGHPDDKIQEHSFDVRYRERLLLFHNTGSGFDNMSDRAGPVFDQPFAARGLAIGDFDNNGAVDVLVGINGGAPLLLKNQAAHKNHWLGVKLVGKKSNSDGIGARITWQAGELKRSQLKVGGGSYLAAHDPRVVLGLGSHSTVDRLEIRWPGPVGGTDRFTNVAADRYITVVEGEGIR